MILAVSVSSLLLSAVVTPLGGFLTKYLKKLIYWIAARFREAGQKQKE